MFPEANTSFQELQKRLTKLENLNPDITANEMQELLSLASQAGEDAFASVAEQTARLGKMYLESDVKVIGENIMRDYFSELDKGAKLLQDAGEIMLPSAGLHPSTFCTALVPVEQTEALDFCKILNRTSVPKTLVKAADAFRRRNQVVSTVFEIALKALWKISPERTESWIIELYKKHDGNLDPDIVRDTLSTALASNHHLSKEFMEWVIRFASDNNLLEYWPNVVRYADRVICRNSLVNWFESTKPRNALLSQLRLYSRIGRHDDDTMMAWNKHALEEVGGCVQRFMSLEKSGLEAKWRSAALMSELRRIAALYVPVLLTSDQILDLPDGTDQLAMSFMGLAGETREKWEEALTKYAYRAVHLSFMLDLKAGRKPVDTIRRLTFGDNVAFRKAYAELDLLTEKFDSTWQRDKVCEMLSVFYASYRRPQILGYEIAKRYKQLMRLIHDDFLSQHLDAEQLNEVHALDILPEISSIAAEARKYLAKRRAEENTLEQLLAAKISFERFVRQKRAQIAMRCL